VWGFAGGDRNRVVAGLIKFAGAGNNGRDVSKEEREVRMACKIGLKNKYGGRRKRTLRKCAVTLPVNARSRKNVN